MASTQEIPRRFICPITLGIMKDPYIDSDGNSFEGAIIKEWIALNHKSPITRNPMTIDSLVPNRALKEAIEEYTGITTGSVSLSQTITENSIKDNERDPINIVIVVDNSGSMQEICNNKNATEQMNFTRLDLVKQIIRIIIKALGQNDKVSLIKFNTSATIMTGSSFIPVNSGNKQILNEKLDEITANGGTNIWDALRVSVDMISNNKCTNDKKTHILLFTDGESNQDPPRGIIPTFKDYITKFNDLNITLNTFGFGYDINSSLLFELSELKNGIFGFIPDSSMIGTVFINSIAHLMTNNKDTPFVDTYDACNKLVMALRQNKLSDFIDFASVFSHDQFIKDILLDCVDSTNESDGQIFKAITPAYYKRWGKHYILSVMSAYTNKFCLNFMDHGVQHFKNPQFNKFQKILEDIFINMPPPVATGRGYGQYSISSTPINSQQFSQAFFNQNGVCFIQDTLVKIAGGPFVSVQDVTKGMKLEALGKVGTVICVLKTKFNGVIRRSNNAPQTGITPYHPVFFNKNTDIMGLNHEEYDWVFPCESNNFHTELVTTDTYVYDFILDSNHIVELDGGVFATTLNHGRTGNVIGHDYFGTHKIILDLMQHEGWANGYIQLDDYKFIRGGPENRICGIVFN